MHGNCIGYIKSQLSVKYGKSPPNTQSASADTQITACALSYGYNLLYRISCKTIEKLLCKQTTFPKTRYRYFKQDAAVHCLHFSARQDTIFFRSRHDPICVCPGCVCYLFVLFFLFISFFYKNVLRWGICKLHARERTPLSSAALLLALKSISDDSSCPKEPVERTLRRVCYALRIINKKNVRAACTLIQ